MTGAESITGFKRLWQGLLVQLVCQLVPVIGIGTTMLLEASGAEDGIAVGVGGAIAVAALVVQMAAAQPVEVHVVENVVVGHGFVENDVVSFCV